MQNTTTFNPNSLQSPLIQLPRENSVEAIVKETHSHYLVSMQVPQVKKDDLKIEVKRQKQLLVRGCFGNFFKSVTFSTLIQSEHVKASLVDGTLQLLLPKVLTSPNSLH